jgi:hypothetical protein
MQRRDLIFIYVKIRVLLEESELGLTVRGLAEAWLGHPCQLVGCPTSLCMTSLSTSGVFHRHVWDIPQSRRDVPVSVWNVPQCRWDIPVSFGMSHKVVWDIPLAGWNIPLAG